MQNIILSPLSLDQLKKEIAEAVKEEISPLFNRINVVTQQNEFITRKEAAKILGVSLPTILEWTKTGKIKGYRIGSRIRYKRTELELSLTQIKV